MKDKVKKGTTFFAAWDDTDQLDVDFTTEQVLAEKETFDILKGRGYETLEEYGEKQSKKVQEYELHQQNNAFEFNFESYIKRQEEEYGGEEDVQSSGAKSDPKPDEEVSEEYAEEYDDEDDSPSKKIISAPSKNRRGGGMKHDPDTFVINTSYCRSELELL